MRTATLLIFILFFATSCSQSIDKSKLNGSWRMSYILKSDKDILNKDSGKLLRYRPVHFDEDIIDGKPFKQITIELNSDTDIYADFILSNDKLILSRSTHKEFEGQYEVILVDSIDKNTNRTVQHLLIKSDSIEIKASRFKELVKLTY